MQDSREDDKLKLLENLDPYESNNHGTRLVLQDGGNTNITPLATPTAKRLYKSCYLAVACKMVKRALIKRASNS